MTKVYEEYDAFVKKDGTEQCGWIENCTTCNTALFIQDHVLEGVDIKDLQKEDLEIMFALR